MLTGADLLATLTIRIVQIISPAQNSHRRARIVLPLHRRWPIHFPDVRQMLSWPRDVGETLRMTSLPLYPECGLWSSGSISPGSSLGNEHLRPHPELLSQDLHFNKGPRLIILMVPQEHWWRCMLFCKLQSQKALNTGQVRYYLTIAQLCCMTNYLKTQWPVTISMYSHAHGSVGQLAFSTSRQTRLQGVCWVWMSSMCFPYFCNGQAICHAFLSWWWESTERQRGAQMDSTLQPLLGSYH